MRPLLLIVFAGFMTFSCRDEEPTIPSVTERVAAAKENLVAELTAPSNGWKVNYRPNNSSGSFLILLDFDANGNVQIRSDVIAEGGEYLESNITYRIDASLNIELIFESYVVFHYLFDLGNGALEGEFEFIYERAEGQNLVFSSKSDLESITEIVFEPATGNERSEFSTTLFEQIDAFQGNGPVTIGEFIFGQSNLESPRQQLVLAEENISLFWLIDITGRFIIAELAAEGTTESEILANDNFLVLNQFSGYTFRDGKMILNTPISFTLDDQPYIIDQLEIGEFTENGPQLCAGTGTQTPTFNASSEPYGDASIIKSLISSDGSGFVENGIYLVNAFFIFDEEGNSLQEEGVINDNLPDAGALVFFYDIENDTLPDNMLGFIATDTLGNTKWIFNEVEPVKELNRISFNFSDQFYTLGDVSSSERSAVLGILEEVFSGNTMYIYDFDYFDGLTIYWLYNPCNGYELLLVEN